MRGTIEIYSDSDLVYESTNLLVDGAGEAVAEIMTVSPSLSGIATASALLDTSNYTIQSISFGKGKEGYLNNAHKFDGASALGAYVDWNMAGAGKDNNSKDSLLAVCGAPSNPSSTEHLDPYFNTFTVKGFSGPNKAITVLVANPSTSSYSPVGGLPSAPSPMDDRLEVGIDMSTHVNTIIKSDTTINLNGQNLNIMPYINDVSFSSVNTVGVPYGYGSYFGCYPEGSGTGGTDWYILSAIDTGTVRSEYFPHPTQFYYALSGHVDTADPFDQNTSAIVVDATLSGNYVSMFNEASSMETRGHVGKVYDPITSSVGLSGDGGAAVTSPTSGLIVSSMTDSSSTGEVYYFITCGSGDLGLANLYGGIYHMGLHTIDIPNTVGNYSTGHELDKADFLPPFDFHPYAKPRRQYRLFAKHNFTRNLCYIEDNDTAGGEGVHNYKDLTIVWKIDFL
jgi:hypothetical protein